MVIEIVVVIIRDVELVDVEKIRCHRKTNLFEVPMLSSNSFIERHVSCVFDHKVVNGKTRADSLFVCESAL